MPSIAMKKDEKKKKKKEEAAESSSDEEEVGPAPPPPAPTSSSNAAEEEPSSSTAKAGPEKVAVAEPPTKKKRKVLEFEESYLRNIPRAEAYEKSFMHRDTITHVAATSTDFIITASADGHLKFWKKLHSEGIEFVKHFRSHLGPIVDMKVNCNGMLMATISTDKSIKIFDVPNFDMINMIKLDFTPRVCVWVHQPADPISALAVADRDSSKLFIFDGKGQNSPIHTLDKLHSKNVLILEYNPVYETTISVDAQGIIEYWHGTKRDYEFPKQRVEFESKLDTDLYEFVKIKIPPSSLCIAPNGNLFATLSVDRKIRIFKFSTGKIVKVLNESIQTFIDEKSNHNLANVEFNRRVAVEKELDKSPNVFSLQRMTFDESNNFLLYPSPLGVKIVNLLTNKCVRKIGKAENMRVLAVALCRAVPLSKSGTASDANEGNKMTAEMLASDNPALQRAEPDPLLVTCAYKKNRTVFNMETEMNGKEILEYFVGVLAELK